MPNHKALAYPMQWQLAKGIVCRFSPEYDECLIYARFTGAAHVATNVGALIVDLCRNSPQTTEHLLAEIHEAFETEQEDDLTQAGTDAVRQLQSLGILVQCDPP